MRLPRNTLVARIADRHAPGILLVEAPAGFGKSWVVRRATPSNTLRLRASVEALGVRPDKLPPVVVVDDAHELGPDDVRRLVEAIEDLAEHIRLVIVGRLLPEAVHRSVELMDGEVFDTDALSITVDEVVEALPSRTATVAERIIEVTDGCVQIVAAGLTQVGADSHSDPVTTVARLVRAQNAATLMALGPADAAMVGLLARAPGLDRPTIERLGPSGFVDRAVLAGAPLRRRVGGVIDLVTDSTFRTTEVDRESAAALADELHERDRPLDAVSLLLDAGVQDRAADMMIDLPESITDTAEPRLMLGLLARLGSVVEREPALLLVRARTSAHIGRLDTASDDTLRALDLVADAAPPLRRRVQVEVAASMMHGGRTVEAAAAASAALRDIGPGEEATLARANTVLAQAVSSGDTRQDLQSAAESYRAAIAAWEAGGELGRARTTRCELVLSVLVPLGRYDEALTQMSTILAAAELADAERAWMLLAEGFVLINAQRLDSAESRFGRCADLGYVQDNPRIIATAAWGRAMTSVRRDDLAATLRWVAMAENSALSETDDVLGVPFLCDVATGLGGLGELELARRYLARATERRNLFPQQVALSSFVLDARSGVLGDVAVQINSTPPADRWRVFLVAALATVMNGDREGARSLLAEAERELLALGLSDFRIAGERWTYDEIQSLLTRATEREIAPSPATWSGSAESPGRVEPHGASEFTSHPRRLCVIGGSVILRIGDHIDEVPTGNPQRLVGVVVAHGGSASSDQLSEAIWPGDDVDASRARLRNVLLRLRRGVGDVIIRSGSGVRLADDVSCDLHEFEQMAADALASARSDPDVAGRLADEAVRIVDGAVFADFEYEDWAVAARRSVDHKLIALLDLLSVQAEDAGDLPRAQALAERALRLDRYTDSRYVRLAELLGMQDRVAAAVAVLDDAAEVAREMGGALPTGVSKRRGELLRRVAN